MADEIEIDNLVVDECPAPPGYFKLFQQSEFALEPPPLVSFPQQQYGGILHIQPLPPPLDCIEEIPAFRNFKTELST